MIESKRFISFNLNVWAHNVLSNVFIIKNTIIVNLIIPIIYFDENKNVSFEAILVM